MAKVTDNDFERSLLDCWQKPEDAGEPIAAIATTYEFDVRLWEMELLPRFLGLETDAIEELDPFWIERETKLAEHYAAVLMDAHAVPPKVMSSRWDRIAVSVPNGILHSKIILLQWTKCVRLIIGSANLSEPGYRTNHEIFFVLDFYNDSASPPREVFNAFINALERITTWPYGNFRLNVARRRVLDALKHCRKQVAAWRSLRNTYRPRDDRLFPIFIEPNTQHNLFDQLDMAWKNRKANWALAMSPFWDDSKKQAEKTAKAFGDRLSKDVLLFFVCVGEWIKPKSTALVQMPSIFAENLKNQDREIWVSPVVNDNSESINSSRRLLHAKSLLLVNSQSELQLLYVGSSNLTARGTGLSPRNFEAGVALLRHTSKIGDVESLCPGTSSKYDLTLNKVQFADELERSEDEGEEDNVAPPIQLFAEYDVIGKNLRVLTNQRNAPGFNHTLALSMEKATKPLLRYKHGDANPYPLNISMMEIPTTLQMKWTDTKGKERQYLIPVDIVELHTLPPPEPLRDLTLDELIAYLKSSRPPWRHFAHRKDRAPAKSGQGKDLDPLHQVDTSHYLTTHVKRFGEAVAGLRRRLTQYPASSVEGLEARFFGPVGPWVLSKAICRICNAELVESPKLRVQFHPESESQPGSIALAAFLSSELALSLRWVKLYEIYDGANKKKADQRWNTLVRRIARISEQLSKEDHVADSLRQYIRQSFIGK